MNIHDIKRIHGEKFPGNHFFDRSTMRFYGQTMRSFSVTIWDKEKNLFRIAAPAYFGARRVGLTERIFNATTGELSAVPKEG